MFEVDDRGDAVAEIHLNGNFGEISAEVIAVWSEWDRQLNREPINIPIGFKITGLIVGFVNGLTAEPMDEKGNSIGSATSAFPGWARINGVPQVRVDSLKELEQYLESNIGVAFDLLIQHSPQSVLQ